MCVRQLAYLPVLEICYLYSLESGGGLVRDLKGNYLLLIFPKKWQSADIVTVRIARVTCLIWKSRKRAIIYPSPVPLPKLTREWEWQCIPSFMKKRWFCEQHVGMSISVLKWLWNALYCAQYFCWGDGGVLEEKFCGSCVLKIIQRTVSLLCLTCKCSSSLLTETGSTFSLHRSAHTYTGYSCDWWVQDKL